MRPFRREIKMSRRKTYGFYFLWKCALGISALRGKITRATGIPTTKSVFQRKLVRSALGIGAGNVIGAVAAATTETSKTQNLPQQPISLPRTARIHSCLNSFLIWMVYILKIVNRTADGLFAVFH
jgi:hypothetical protein